MDIAVVGTSNSVIGQNGFIASLRLDHRVWNQSTGRTPYYSHIKTILEHRADLERHDLVIVDHYVNDVHFYGEALGEDYRANAAHLYRLLASLNTTVLNVLFPIHYLHQDDAARTRYLRLKALSEDFGIPCLDLNAIPFENGHFRDQLHLTPEASYVLGLFLSRAIATLPPGRKPSGGRLRQSPYTVSNARALFPPERIAVFENSLVRVEYAELADALVLPASSPTGRLISLGYLRPKWLTGCSGVTINGIDAGLSGTGYFHEAIGFEATGPVEIRPIRGSARSCPNLMARGLSNGRFEQTLLADLLFYDPAVAFDVTAADRPALDLDLSVLGEALARIKPGAPFGSISHKTVAKLRDTAEALGNSDPQIARELLDLGCAIQPFNTALAAKRAELSRRGEPVAQGSV